jgi:hypothetical protein
MGEVTPQPETTCEDTNCNGLIGEQDQCMEGTTKTCYSAPPETLGIGVCHGGVSTFMNDLWGPCVGEVLPVPEICGNGVDDNCDGITDPPVTVFFRESFADNDAGWLLDPEWQIGPAVAGPAGMCADPGADTTPTADNGIAGVAIGGCSPTSLSHTTHPYYYLTSPVVSTAGATQVTLQYNRWLLTGATSSDIEVWDGSAWVVIWQSPSPIADASWQHVIHDLTAYANAAMRVRWGVSIESSMADPEGGFSIDDVQITSGPCN